MKMTVATWAIVLLALAVAIFSLTACVKSYDTSPPPSGAVGDKYFKLCEAKEQHFRELSDLRATATWMEYEDSTALPHRLNENEQEVSRAIVQLWENCVFQEEQNQKKRLGPH